MREEESAGEGHSIHAKTMSRVKAENGLITSRKGGIEGFISQLKKVLLKFSFYVDVNLPFTLTENFNFTTF